MSIIFGLPLDATTNINDLINGGLIQSGGSFGQISQNGAFGKNYWNIGGANNSQNPGVIVLNLPSTFYIRQRMFFTVNDSGSFSLINFVSPNNIVQCAVVFSLGANQIQIYGGAYGVFNVNPPLIGNSVPGAFTSSSYNFYEIEVNIASSGNINIRMNGNPNNIVTCVGNTQADASSSVCSQIQYSGVGNSMYIQDISINDTNITTLNPWNSWLGDIQVNVWQVISNNACDFTPISGTNYQNIDSSPTVNYANYNYSNTVGAQDTFDITIAANSTVSNVVCVAPVVLAAKSDAGTRAMTTVLLSESANVVGANVYLSTSPQYFSTFYGRDPNTNGNWSLANAAAVKPGYNISA